MNIKELVEAIHEEKAKELGKMPKAKTALIVKEALASIGRELDATEEGKVRVPGLGNFIVKAVGEGETSPEVSKRILLRRPRKK